MCLYIVIYNWFVGNVVLCIHGGFGSWYDQHEGDHCSQQSHVGGFTLWWFLCLNLSAVKSVLPVSGRALGFTDKVQGCAVWAAGPLIATAGTQTLNLACACGRLCPSGTLSFSDPRTSWPAYAVGVSYVSVVTKQQRMPGKQTWWHSMQWGGLEEVTLWIVFLQWLRPAPM